MPVVSFLSSCFPCSYYIDGRVAKVTDFLKTRLLDTLSDQIRKIQKVSECKEPARVREHCAHSTAAQRLGWALLKVQGWYSIPVLAGWGGGMVPPSWGWGRRWGSNLASPRCLLQFQGDL